MCEYYLVRILSLESNEWGESRHRRAWPRRVGVGINVRVRRLPRGCVRAPCAVLGDHGLVVGFCICGGALLIAKRRADAFKPLGLPLPGVVVGGVAHVVVNEGVLRLLVLVVAVCQLDTNPNKVRGGSFLGRHRQTHSLSVKWCRTRGIEFFSLVITCHWNYPQCNSEILEWYASSISFPFQALASSRRDEQQVVFPLKFFFVPLKTY